MGVPTAPKTVAKMFMSRRQQTDSNLGWPIERRMGVASAAGVPKPDAPSIKYANAQPMSIISATWWPFVISDICTRIHAITLADCIESKR